MDPSEEKSKIKHEAFQMQSTLPALGAVAAGLGFMPDQKSPTRVVTPFGQEHLLEFWDKLSIQERKILEKQLSSLDMEMVDKYIASILIKKKGFYVSDVHAADHVEVQTASDIKRMKLKCLNPDEISSPDFNEDFIKMGEKALKRGKVACVTSASTMDYKIKYDRPLALMPITPIKKKTVIQLFAETIRKTCEKYKYDIPWYIVMSAEDKTMIQTFMQKNKYFGLDEEYVNFVVQKSMPVVDAKTKLLMLKSQCEIQTSPGGSGGFVFALKENGIFDKMRDLGIKYISHWDMRNPLSNILDLEFLGAHLNSKAKMSVKIVEKESYDTTIDHVCDSELTGRHHVVPLEELKANLASLEVFAHGYVGVNILDVKFLESVDYLPVHGVKTKRVGIRAKSTDLKARNAISFEMRASDLVTTAKSDVHFYVVEDADEYSPILEVEGEKLSAEVASLNLSKKYKNWVETEFRALPVNLQKVDLEISPIFASSIIDFHRVVNKKGLDSDVFSKFEAEQGLYIDEKTF